VQSTSSILSKNERYYASWQSINSNRKSALRLPRPFGARNDTEKTIFIAMRSQNSFEEHMSNKPDGLVDKLWDIFSSMKLGLVLLGLIALAAGIGTLIPQESADPKGAQAVA